MATKSVAVNLFAPGLHSIVVNGHILALPVHLAFIRPRKLLKQLNLPEFTGLGDYFLIRSQVVPCEDQSLRSTVSLSILLIY